MNAWRRVSLRWRLALALATVAVASVALATVLSSAGLHGSLDEFAQNRLNGAAVHAGQLAADLYKQGDGISPADRVELQHLAHMNGYRLWLSVGTTPTPAPAPHDAGDHVSRSASAPVTSNGQVVGYVTVAPLTGNVLTGEDQALLDSLDRRHLVAGGLALLLGLVIAVVLATTLSRPLRRLTRAARKMQAGDLATRVRPEGARELQELGAALNLLAQTLENEERARRSAAADVAHELRTPLAAIVSRIEAARDGVLADDAANLSALHTEALRLTRLVEDLERLADAERPGLTLEKERVDLGEVARERAEGYRQFMEAKDLSLSVQVTPAPISADRGRIVQVVDNLLSNALRYTDEHGSVMVSVRCEQGDAVLTVADTGIGIGAEDLPHVFDRFWRGEPSRARNTGGAGIGLAIVRELVRANDGRISVASTLGEGTTFTVRFALRT